MSTSYYPHPIIAREGWPFIAGAFVVALVVQFFAGWVWALPLWLVALLVLQFFRDPPRVIPTLAGAVLAPADGRIVAVDKVQDPYLSREALKISVFMNVFNVHSNRSPVDGEIRDQWYFPGSFLNASLPKASLENERNALWIRTKEGRDVTCVQIAGLIAKRIVCHVHPGEHLARGQRFGFIRFGSRVDVYLPPGMKVNVGIGDKVQATQTVLAEFR
ncbi:MULTISPECIES: phosphatidylserine decarboxylase [Nitrosomonas]|uniref:Phosphatidylserine decarboxylase proenzyme n=2 Tax=Nitrosomonas eutropha TaxID=916 RepID=PSD_NITEC|nr:MULTISPECIES: phosphatidylserine decarboxylase [Nitrosomonas]Q0AGM1.1 RecName: Full=Phosphatidylserine decarboxylase proenzyme; Contains: RecName: Full=Phosphatidylserine decarboxylase alpha chain; Contains: RecName: Full=Phosphatidylserine decarboxylase beta chain [Nitrosomonas eutropha C91]ABI59511.1 phosphatidylserine decarboxylase related protein [Nitrosomonas eutropha C91]MXS79949.1 phosphatidylserine decarboxylase [Nitrosomonas sp. GH22]PXV76066.1 phosphatidylserine decarboxylase [Nitr